MEAKNADLAAVRIDRALSAVLLATRGARSSATPVHLTPATMVSPIRSGAVMIASGNVVAQRKAAVASGGFLPAVRAACLNIVSAPRAA